MKKIIFIVLLSLLFASCLRQTTTKVSQYSTIQKDSDLDSTRITNLINNLVLNFVSDEIDTSSTIDWDSVSTILYMQQTTCCDGRVVYSPDSLFKIYVISGATYPNVHFWEPYVYSNNGNKLLMKKEISSQDITNIYKLHDNKYLIIQQEWHRGPAGVPNECKSILLVSIKNDSLLFNPLIIETNEDNFSTNFYFEDNSLTICQPGIFSEVPELTFDSLNSNLNYKFRKHHTLDSGDDSDSLITGSFKYENGVFKNLNHEVKFIETEE